VMSIDAPARAEAEAVEMRLRLIEKADGGSATAAWVGASGDTTCSWSCSGP
jgi:hypothetical protein